MSKWFGAKPGGGEGGRRKSSESWVLKIDRAAWTQRPSGGRLWKEEARLIDDPVACYAGSNLTDFPPSLSGADARQLCSLHILICPHALEAEIDVIKSTTSASVLLVCQSTRISKRLTNEIHNMS